MTLQTLDVITLQMGEELGLKYIPKNHIGQVLQQALVMDVEYCIYIAASEHAVLYIAVLRVSRLQRQTCKTALENSAGPAVSWAHQLGQRMPSFADAATKKLLKNHLNFWNLINNYANNNHPFPPLKLFKHGAQSFYSKTKGGVDGSAQARAVLRSATTSLKWEQKLVSQTFKTVAINAFIGWRMSEKAQLLEDKVQFGTLDSYRDALNSVESLADFIYVASRELLAYAENLSKLDGTGTELENNDPEIGAQEATDLIRMAASRKKKRLHFFNSANGIKLRMQVRDHFILTSAIPKDCILCGNDSGPAAAWRGHRTRKKCSKCCAHLCVDVYAGLRKTCWDVWHSSKLLVKRHTPAPTRTSASGNASNAPHVEVAGTGGGACSDAAMNMTFNSRESIATSTGLRTTRQGPTADNSPADNPRPLRRSRRS